MTATLSAATVRGQHVELQWHDGRPSDTLPLMWLRDNCQSVESQHPDTKQRLVDTFRITADIAARTIAVEDQGQMLKVEWAEGGHVSRFAARFLAALRVNPDVLPVRYTTWDRDRIGGAVPQVAYAAFMGE